MNIFSAFDGISCGRVALGRIGIDPERYYASEIDPYAIKIAQKNYPDTIQLGDIRDIQGRDLPGIDLMLGGSPCFKAGTLVLTDQGYKPIEEIRIGDKVLTHKQRFREVIAVGSEKSKHIYKVKAQGFPMIYSTSNHPYYIKQCRRVGRKRERRFSKADWVPASKLKKQDFLCMPFFDEEIDIPELADDDLYLLGRFVADGYSFKTKRRKRKDSYSYKFCITVGKHEIEDFKERWGNRFNYVEDRTAFKCFIYQQKWFLMGEEFGKYAHGKFIPLKYLKLPKRRLKLFLQGYIEGDGHLRPNGTIRCATVSKKLALSLCMAIAKVFETNTQIYEKRNNPQTVIEGRRDSFELTFRTEHPKQSHSFIARGEVWNPFRRIEYQGIDEVYNISVLEDESYTADNAIVHNCTGFASGGKKLAFDDPQSALFFEYVRLLKEIKPKHFLLENVPMKKEYRDIISDHLGVEPLEINSSLVSAQNRRRLYWFNWGLASLPEDRGIGFSDICEKFGYPGASRGRRIDLSTRKRDKNAPLTQFAEIRSDNKTNCLTRVSKDNIVVSEHIPPGTKMPVKEVSRRFLTPIECERLQTLPDRYTEGVSTYQRRKACGNGWTVDVIAHILGGIL